MSCSACRRPPVYQKVVHGTEMPRRTVSSDRQSPDRTVRNQAQKRVIMIGLMSLSIGATTSSRAASPRRKDEARAWTRQDRENRRREHYAGYDRLSGLRMRKEHSDWLNNPTNGRIDPPKNSGEGS